MMLLVERELRFEGIYVAAAGPDDWDGQTAVILAHGAGQNMDSPFMSFFHEGIASFGHVSIKFNFSYSPIWNRAGGHLIHKRNSVPVTPESLILWRMNSNPREPSSEESPWAGESRPILPATLGWFEVLFSWDTRYTRPDGPTV